MEHLTEAVVYKESKEASAVLAVDIGRNLEEVPDERSVEGPHQRTNVGWEMLKSELSASRMLELVLRRRQTRFALSAVCLCSISEVSDINCFHFLVVESKLGGRIQRIRNGDMERDVTLLHCATRRKYDAGVVVRTVTTAVVYLEWCMPVDGCYCNAQERSYVPPSLCNSRSRSIPKEWDKDARYYYCKQLNPCIGSFWSAHVHALSKLEK